NCRVERDLDNVKPNGQLAGEHEVCPGCKDETGGGDEDVVRRREVLHAVKSVSHEAAAHRCYDIHALDSKTHDTMDGGPLQLHLVVRLRELDFSVYGLLPRSQTHVSVPQAH